MNNPATPQEDLIGTVDFAASKENVEVGRWESEGGQVEMPYQTQQCIRRAKRALRYEKLTRNVNHWLQRSDQSYIAVRDWTCRQPMRAAVTALVLGVLIGRVWRRD